jgi:hypothetical protein
MRRVMEPQFQIGEQAIEDLKFDLKCRDELPEVLMGLQSLYNDPVARTEVFQALQALIPAGVNPDKGRPGMDLWRILVMGVVKLNCAWDYDKVHDQVNNHRMLRRILMHPDWNQQTYARQTLEDNLKLFTPEIAERISAIAVRHGHRLAGVADQPLMGSCDSFVVKTDVAFPVDIFKLLQALGLIIAFMLDVCGEGSLKGWRKGRDYLKKARKLFNRVRKLKRLKGREGQAKQDERIKAAHLAYLELAQQIVEKARATLAGMNWSAVWPRLKADRIFEWIAHAEREMDQIRRRVIEGATIPQHEKVLSLFEEHTEWINKGKKGVPVELGVPVGVVKDQFGFFLHHRVMTHESDEAAAQPMIAAAKQRFPRLKGCSFDRGFHSPRNQEQLPRIVDVVILPRKGRLSAEALAIEQNEEFQHWRRKHSAVEAAISALDNHALDLCRDHGLDGFKRYVALGILARNLQIIGHLAQQQALKRQRRAQKLKRAA